MQIVLTLQPDGRWMISYPADKPFVTIDALEGAIALVKQQAAQREMRPAVELATESQVPPVPPAIQRRITRG